jgi:hypothetical protein
MQVIKAPSKGRGRLQSWICHNEREDWNVERMPTLEPGELVANGLAGTFRVAFLKELGDIAEKSHDGNYHGAREPDKKYDLKKTNEEVRHKPTPVSMIGSGALIRCKEFIKVL